LDVTDIIDYNLDLLNRNDLSHCYFHLDKSDPTVGFPYDASRVFGGLFPSTIADDLQALTSDPLYTRLLVGSHLAQYIRHQLEERKGYTATVGISTSKLLSKLVGNVHKPKNQTTLLPPYDSDGSKESNVTQFLDPHDIGSIPGIGFKSAQKIRSHVLGRDPDFNKGLLYGGTLESLTVRDVRLFPGMGPELLEQILGGAGAPKGIGGRAWELITGIDDAEVGKARSVPTQISIEDSYVRLDTFEELRKELLLLAASLIRRMRMDLTEDDEETVEGEAENRAVPPRKRWLAHPRTIRLSTRPRPSLNPDGTRPRGFNRISRSGPIPNFIFSLTDGVDALAEKLVFETLIGMFRKLHPEKSGWNLSLVNIAVTNMAEAAADSKDSSGRDIGRMFRMQDSVLKEWKVEDRDVAPEDDREGTQAAIERAGDTPEDDPGHTDENVVTGLDAEEGLWDSDNDDETSSFSCPLCGARIPPFAMKAHETFHGLEE
jgi:DNA polymerase iota